MADPECQPLLTPSNPPGPRTRRWGIGCLIVVSFLQTISFSKTLDVYRHDIENLFREDVQKYTAYFVLLAVIFYVSPIAISLYADVIVGKYTALFIGLVVKFTGYLLAFCAVLKQETSHNIDQMTVKVLAAVYSVSLTLVTVGVCFTFPLLVTFGAQQVKQKFESQSSFARWSMAILMTGALTEVLLLSADSIHLPIYIHAPLLRSHPQTVYHAVYVIMDGLSIGIFLLGKSSYNKPTTQEGLKSFKMLVNIARRHIRCLPASRRYETNETIMRMCSLQEIVTTHKLERMKMRKGVIAVALFSSVAVSVLVNAWLGQLALTTFLPHADVSPLWFLLCLIPLMECVIRKCGYVLWQNNLTYHLRISGFGIFLTVLALLTAGIIASSLPHQDSSDSPFCVLPLNILSGIAVFIIVISVITFCLMECPPGLSTFVAVLFMNFCLLMLPVGVLFDKVDWNTSSTKVVCYVLAAITLVVLLVIYIPVSVWYVRADAACARLLAEEVSNSASDPERELARSMSDGDGS